MACCEAGGKDAVAPDALYPAFREELICTLLETLLAHTHAASTLEPASAQASDSEIDSVQSQLEQLALARSGAGQQGTPQGSPPGVAGGSSWEELPAAVAAVAVQQRTAELTEWLGCAKIALQA